MDAEVIASLELNGIGPLIGRAMEDLNATLLAWPTSQSIAKHVNSEVDVIMVVLAGCGIATCDEVAYEIQTGSILLIPKGAERSIESRSDDFRYLNVHKRRRALMPGPRRT